MVRPVLPRAVYLVLVLILAVLARAGRADAGVSPLWQELGGSARGNGVSPKLVSDGSVAVDGRRDLRVPHPAREVSVSPTFKDVTALTLTKSGQGTISSTPAGINCGPACSSVGFDFARGIVVKLNPRPPVGWTSPASPPTRDFSTVVTWGSSHQTRARVNFFGKVTGIAPGGVTITATNGAGPAALSDAASITVVP
jgi:Bacterial Ig-like domain (group 2)